MRMVQLIVNPIAGRGHGAGVVPAIEARLRRLGCEVATFVTRRRGDAREFAASLERTTSLLLVVGGDGTLNEVVNGQVEIPLALFPVGTGNAFAADQGIGGTLDALEALVRDGVPRWFDLGAAGGRKFINMASCGILGQIHRAFWVGRRGPDSFVRCLLTAFGILRRGLFRPVTIRCDGRMVDRVAHIVVVGNTRTYSPGVSFTPEASPFDGALDVCTLPAPRAVDLVRWLVGVLRQQRLEDPRIGYLRARTVHMGGTGIECHVDGEYVGPGPLSVSVLHRHVQILVPPATVARVAIA
ncbi:MAG: diacylglycerol kinase family lipid kinase [Candidatus Rokubacteria bacterium]|nr:diacylglycerol kinase family lipid kinase [Candidatus Rokubacteria bacterium]